MPADKGGVTRETLPHGQWLRVGSRQVRVVENLISGHIIEVRLAQKRDRQREDVRRNLDAAAPDGL